jgi:hypothetical protein
MEATSHHAQYEGAISILAIIFVFFLAENSKTQSRKHEIKQHSDFRVFVFSCFRDQFFYLQTCLVPACPD